ncbi:phosphoribosylanthranilate isomerase, partial [uncultured Thermomonas sp.]|uniref:phosphoribosylanthranilate isomerase n=1 Tax=uncultured Thermomonas sp. TaxID=318121 RepID=UPI00259171BD
MTRSEDVQLAVALQVDFIGLIFAARSPRRVTLAQAADLRALVPSSTRVVALLMDNTPAEIEAIIAQVQPDLLQFHGSEVAACCAGFGLPYFKAIAMGDAVDPLPAMAAFSSASGFVLDGHGAGEQGGSGKRFDWSRLPSGQHMPILLAGGLTADNVASALHAARPWGVDVASGIETGPGRKDA